MIFKLGRELRCPKCGATEDNPSNPDTILIRGFKVDVGRGWESQCLVCSGYYRVDIEVRCGVQIKRYVEQPAKHNPAKGWFL